METQLAVTWPHDLKRTALRSLWFEKLSALEPGLNLDEVAGRLGITYRAAHSWSVLFSYSYSCKRRGPQGVDWSSVDWSQRDAEIARTLGVSRERVRQARSEQGAGPSEHELAVRQLMQFTEQHRSRFDGRPLTETASEVVRAFGGRVSTHVARHALIAAGVRSHRPQSRWRHTDWRLPNATLADIWGYTPKYFAKVRDRIQAGRAEWDCRSAESSRDPQYLRALEQERQRTKGRKGSRTNAA